MAKYDKQRQIKYRAKYPEKYIYHNLKNNARKRGIEFTITLAEWVQWLKDNPRYLSHRGRLKTDLNIDRVKSWKGYSIDNIQILTKEQNRKKQTQDQKEKYKELSKSIRQIDPECGF